MTNPYPDSDNSRSSPAVQELYRTGRLIKEAAAITIF